MKKNGLKSLFLLLFILCFSISLIMSQERFRRSAPYPDPLPEFKLPAIESALLSNGLALSVIQRDDLPIITLRLIIFAGESFSPERFQGIAAMTTKMIGRGTSTLSHSEIQEIIEAGGGYFSSSAFPDFAMFTLTFSEEYLDRGLETLSQMILQPSFTRREIENVKRSMFYDIVRKSSDPEIVTRRQLFQMLFRNHPYKKGIYNEDVIKNLNQNILSVFFDRYYRPNNSRIILTGNLNLSTATRKVSRYFNTWKSKEMKFSFISPPEPNKELKVCLVDVPQERDVTIYMGNIISPLASNDYFPLLVLNQVLGGTPNSRLFMNLRESKGFAYYAFSQIELFKACGVFFIRAKVRPEVAYASVMEILKETEKTTKERIPSYEIEQAKSYLIGNFPLKIETYDDLSLKVAQIHAFQLGEEHWSKYYENIMLIDSKKVFEIAQKYPVLTPVVVIGGDIKTTLEHIREFDVIDVYNNKGILQYSIKKGESE
jgi:zinc protease